MRNYKRFLIWSIVAIGTATALLFVGYQIGRNTNGPEKFKSIDGDATSPIAKLDKQVPTQNKQKHDPLVSKVPKKTNNRIVSTRRSKLDKQPALNISAETDIEQDDYRDEDTYEEDILNEDFVEQSFEDTLAQQQYQAELAEIESMEERYNEEKLYEENDDAEISAEEAVAMEIESQNEGYDIPIDDTETYIQTEMQNAIELWENTFNR